MKKISKIKFYALLTRSFAIGVLSSYLLARLFVRNVKVTAKTTINECLFSFIDKTLI